MAKNIMRRFRIGEISAVDRPAQVGATALLMKRADGDPVENFAKATFRQHLESSQLDAKFSRAFYEAFDGIYTVNDAFREALKDQYNDREETARQYVEAVADLARRAVEATSGLAKSDTPNPSVIKAAIEAAIVEAQGETDMPIANRTQLVAAITKFQTSGGTQAEIDAIKTAATTLNAEDALPATGVLAKAAAPIDTAALVARVEKAERLAALTPDVRKFYDGLADDAARDAFLAKSDADRQAQMTAATGDDPVLYKTIDGVEIRKSDGAAALALARSNDALTARVAKAEAVAGNADLRKRAETDLSKLAGTVDTHMALLKAVDTITDTAVHGAVMETLRSANKSAGGAFTRIGTTAGGATVVEKTGGGGLVDDVLKGADAELDQLAKAAMPQHGGDYYKAYQAVLETPQGKELYNQSVAAAAA